jgi:transcriptional regulator with XRE-family HTH domain
MAMKEIYIHPLRDFRFRHGVTLEELAERCRTTSASISRIERRRQSPSMAMLRRLTKATGLSADDFIGASQ